MNEPLLRFLALARQNLGGVDARAEIGGAEPTGDHVIWHSPQPEFRILVLFAATPPDRAALTGKLVKLCESFLSATSMPLLGGRGHAPETTVERDLEDTMRALVEKASARVAAVIDRSSPIIWASSLGQAGARKWPESGGAQQPVTRENTDAELMARALELSRRDDAESQPFWTEGGVVFAHRWFAGVYCVLLVFDERSTELKAEAALIRALPQVERLVMSLPPIDPRPPGARVLSVPPRIRLLK